MCYNLEIYESSQFPTMTLLCADEIYEIQNDL
jgi:hypothetical protein